MTAEQKLKIVLREMLAYAHGWRHDWSDFDGRTLRDQLVSLAAWAGSASEEFDYVKGTIFEQRQNQGRRGSVR
jgi:hypothetical protein